MNYLSLLFILAGAFFNYCHHSAESTPRHNEMPVQGAQKVYCERSYTNFAWGYQHNGIYLDPEGNLYSYSYQRSDKPWSPKEEAAPTEPELEDKYNHGKKFIRKIEAQEWQAKLNLLTEASKGQMSKRKQSGADMGANVCRCYVLDATKKQYKQVELRVQGDWSYENLAPSAKELADWLESLRASAEKK